MGFWSGVVQGVKDIDVLREKEDLAEERQGVRDEAAAAREQDIVYRDRMDAVNAERFAVTEARLSEQNEYDRGQDTLRAEERESEQALTRGLAIIEAGGSSFASALGGRGGDVNSGNVISTGGMRAAVMGIEAELDAVGGMDSLEDSDKEWFTTVLDNPAAAAGILAFAHAQREDGNDLPITELPQIIQLAGTLEAAGEDAYKAFRERFIAGNVDMADPAQFLEGMQALRGYKPAQVVWGQVQAVDTPATQKLDFETWEANTTLYARVALANMADGSEKTALATTLVNAGKTGSEHQLTRNDAFVSLWEDYGRPAAEEMGIDSANPRMRPYFSIRSPMSDAQPTGSFNAPQSPQVPVTPGAVSRPSTQAPIEPQAAPRDGPMSFGTVDEATSWFNTLTDAEKTNIPEVVVGGVVMSNDTYVPPEAPAGRDMEANPDRPEPRTAEYAAELRAGAEEIANGVNQVRAGEMGQDELDEIITRMQTRFTYEELTDAMNQLFTPNQ